MFSQLRDDTIVCCLVFLFCRACMLRLLTTTVRHCTTEVHTTHMKQPSRTWLTLWFQEGCMCIVCAYFFVPMCVCLEESAVMQVDYLYLSQGAV